MPIELNPENRQAWLELKSTDVTSTEVSALFDASPYQTSFELYHNKKNKTIVEIDDNERMKWGRRLQDAIAAGISEDKGWTAKPLNTYMRHDKVIGMGSSFDWEIMSEDRADIGILEIKNVDFLQFRDGWLIDGDNIEAPPHIEMQLQHQLEVSNRNWGVIAAFIGGNKPIIIERERDRELGKMLCEKVIQFWNDVNMDIEPKADFVRDAEVIRQIYKDSTGEPLIAHDDSEIFQLCMEYKNAGLEAKIAEERKQAAKSQLLVKIGNSPKVFCANYTISAGEINRKEYTVQATTYRDFRITEKKA